MSGLGIGWSTNELVKMTIFKNTLRKKKLLVYITYMKNTIQFITFCDLYMTRVEVESTVTKSSWKGSVNERAVKEIVVEGRLLNFLYCSAYFVL